MFNQFPICEQKRTDCAACDGRGLCIALIDTHFDYKCPFYKSRAETERIESEIYERSRK